MRFSMAMTAVSALLLTSLSPSAAAAPRGDASPFEAAGGERTRLPLTLVDGGGYTWDIQQDGSVSNGTGDAFDTAMTVTVAGASPRVTGAAVLIEEGRLLVLPTVDTAGGLQLTRSVHVPSGDGYARWLDVLYNPGGETVTTTVVYGLGLGSDSATRVVATSGPDTDGNSSDLGWVTDDADPTGADPAVAVVFGDARGATEPTTDLADGRDTPQITHHVEVPPRAQVGIAVIVAQRTSSDEATTWLQSFSSRDALKKAGVRIQNFAYMSGFHVAGLLRGTEWDLVELRNGNRLKGSLQVPTWEVATPYGHRSVAREDVAGVIFGSPGTAQDALVLHRGDVLVGDLGVGPLPLTASWGGKVPVPRKNIARIGLAHSGDPEERVASTAHVVTLRRGDQLRGQLVGDSLRLAAPYGTVELPIDRVAQLLLTAANGRLHEATLADGSVFSGILLDSAIRLRREDGEELELARSLLESVEAPPLLLEPAIDHSSPVLTLSNGDRWYASPTEEPMHLVASFGPLDLPLAEIGTIDFGTPHPRAAIVQLADGGSVTVQFSDDDLTFRLSGGMELNVPLVFLEGLD